MKAVLATSFVAFVLALPLSSAFAQRSSGTRGPATTHARVDPADTKAGSGSGSTRTATPPGRRQQPGSPFRVNRGVLPITWWWFTDVDIPYWLDASPRNQPPEPLTPPQPAVPPQPALIQPMLTLPRPQTPQASLRGTLRIVVTPPTAQVLVDGFYMGTAEEIGALASGLDVAAGWHRLEFRAAGFTTLSANVTIEANGSLIYRSDLQPIAR